LKQDEWFDRIKQGGKKMKKRDIRTSFNLLKMKESKAAGITLIALVVTIVILIILATISINVVFSEDGIIQRAQRAGRIQKIAVEEEQMELAKVTVAIENKGKLPVNRYIESLIQEKIIKEQNVKYNADGSVQITTNMNRSLKIETDAAGNVIAMAEAGQEEEIAASIQKVQLTESISSIKIDVEVAKDEDATYRYSYKEETGEYKTAYEGKELTYTIGKLKSGTSYWIKVEAVNDSGTVSKEVLGRTKEIVKGKENAIDLHKIGEYKDKFAMIKLDISIENPGTVTAELFIEAVKKEGTIPEENIMLNSNENYEIMTNEGYVFEVTLKSANDVEVTYIGIAQK